MKNILFVILFCVSTFTSFAFVVSPTRDQVNTDDGYEHIIEMSFNKGLTFPYSFHACCLEPHTYKIWTRCYSPTSNYLNPGTDIYSDDDSANPDTSVEDFFGKLVDPGSPEAIVLGYFQYFPGSTYILSTRTWQVIDRDQHVVRWLCFTVKTWTDDLYALLDFSPNEHFIISEPDPNELHLT